MKVSGTASWLPCRNASEAMTTCTTLDSPRACKTDQGAFDEDSCYPLHLSCFLHSRPSRALHRTLVFILSASVDLTVKEERPSSGGTPETCP